MGTGAFTIECWINVGTLNTGIYGKYIIGTYRYPPDSIDKGWAFSCNRTLNSSALEFFMGVAGTGITLSYNGISTLPTGTWNHIAVCRNGSSVCSMYLNGTRVATSSSFTVNDSTTGLVFNVGSQFDEPSNRFDGYISNVRVVKGTAVYDPTLTTLTVPTAPVTAVTNTSLLLNMTNAGIYDAAAQNDVTTVGDAQASTTQKQWSPTSMKFDGSGDFIRMVDAPVFDFGSSDFTIEAWIYTAASGTLVIYSRETTSLNGILFSVSSGSLTIQLASTGSSYSLNLVGGSVSLSTWTYVALTRSGSGTNNIKLYQGTTPGAAISAPSNQGTFSGSIYTSSGHVPIVGARNTNGDLPFNGYIQDLRITKGVARTITASPSAAFPTR
jgi:hypothetical protein